jgi:hypothetical protein
MANYPITLIRRFNELNYAANFINGAIRFGKIEVYKKVEGMRRDEQEGISSVYWDKNAPEYIINISQKRVEEIRESNENILSERTTLNPIYVLCTSTEDADSSKIDEAFGKYKVIIYGPEILRQRIEHNWKQHHLYQGGNVGLAAVVYNKGEIIPPDQFLLSPFEWNYLQKSKRYKSKCEWRYFIICKMEIDYSYENHITINVGNISDICHMKD